MTDMLMPSTAFPTEPAPTKSWLSENRTLVLLGWLLCAVASALIGLTIGSAPLGVGPDSDDMMRVVQLQDLMSGPISLEGWWDTHQARLGVAGTDMHWSRLADVPYLLIAVPLSLLVGMEKAILIAGTIVPGLIAGLFALGLLRGMSALTDTGETVTPSRLPLIAAGIAALHILAFPPRFSFGAFDHHHLQIALLAIAVGYSLIRNPTRRDATIVALACAGSATIGLESAPLIVAICGLWALLWAVRGDRDVITGRFGLTLALASAIGLFLFTDSDAWRSVQCDAFGAPVAALLAAGGLVLFLAPTRLTSSLSKFAALVVLAAACLAALYTTAPACLANPMEMLPVEVREGWLSRITEAQPLITGAVETRTIAAMTGVPLTAGLLGLGMAAYLRRTPERALTWLILSVLTLLALALTLYQVRFYTFAMVLAAFVMATLLLNVLGWSHHADGREVSPLRRFPALIAVLLSSSAASFGIAASALMPMAPVEESVIPLADPIAAALACQSEQTMAALNTLPEGRLWSGLDIAPQLLRDTPHSVLAGNYHRGGADIAKWLVISATPPNEAAIRLRAAGIDYVLICDGGNSEIAFGGTYENGVVAALTSQASATDLTPLDLDLPDSVRVYAVEP